MRGPDLLAFLLGGGRSVRMKARGASMEPALPGGSEVVVSPLREGERPEPGGLVLARASSGALVLHRVVRREGGHLVLKGDAARGVEIVSERDVLGTVRPAPSRPLAFLHGTLSPVLAELTHPTSPALERGPAGRYGEAEELDWALSRGQEGLEPWEAQVAARCLVPGSRVLDLGCGAGREALALTRLGCRVTGLDPVPALVAEAARRCPEGTFRAAPAMALLDPRLLPGPFDLVLLTRGLYGHLPGRRRRVALLKALHDRLAAGGALALSQGEGAPRLGPRSLAVAAGRELLSFLGLGRWERGDRMRRYVTGSGRAGPWVFCHDFAGGDLDAEFAAAGYGGTSRLDGGAVLARR